MTACGDRLRWSAPRRMARSLTASQAASPAPANNTAAGPIRRRGTTEPTRSGTIRAAKIAPIEVGRPATPADGRPEAAEERRRRSPTTQEVGQLAAAEDDPRVVDGQRRGRAHRDDEDHAHPAAWRGDGAQPAAVGRASSVGPSACSSSGQLLRRAAGRARWSRPAARTPRGRGAGRGRAWRGSPRGSRHPASAGRPGRGRRRWRPCRRRRSPRRARGGRRAAGPTTDPSRR